MGDELREREEEMSKLRASSASPSTISTASSGSPLVRGGSTSSSNKRPAPTSIAAAQLQSQQQLEFSNKLASSKGKQVARAKKLAASQAHGHQKSAEMGGGKQHSAFKPEKSPGDFGDGNCSDKGFGYNLAKSLAFRVYRLNDFWSVNKIRYMNLACLVMTLVCLVTILLFSGSGSSSDSGRQVSTLKQRDEFLSSKRSNFDPNSLDDSAIGDEQIDALDSQPLVRSSRDHEKSGSDDQTFDDKTESPPSDPSEREREETTTANPPLKDRTSGGDLVGPIKFFRTLVDRLAKDKNASEAFKGLGHSTKRVEGKSFIMRKPTKDGAIIIISSRSFGPNGTDSSPTPLLEKLLPSMFGIPMRPDQASKDNNETATPPQDVAITLEAEPFVDQAAMSPMMFPPFGLGPLGPSRFTAVPDSGFRSMFSSLPMGFPGPLLDPFTMPPPMPTNGLMSMILRSFAIQDGNARDRTNSLSKTTNVTKTSDESMSSQASQQANSTVVPVANSTNSKNADKSSQADEPEFETFEPEMPRMRMVVVPQDDDGQTDMFVSGGALSFPQSVFSPNPRPRVLSMVGRDSRPVISRPLGVPISLFLRKMFGEIIDDMSGGPLGKSAEVKPKEDSRDNSSGQDGSPQSSTMASSSQARWSEIDDEWTPEGGNEENSRHLRANHRMSSEDDGSDATESVAGAKLGLPDFPTLIDHIGGPVSGSIRRTIRGPGIMIERTFEFPADTSPQVSRVAAGIKSQSISRADLDESSSHYDQTNRFNQHQPPTGSQFATSFGRLSPSGNEFLVPPPVGLIRLLSDISRGSFERPVIKSRMSPLDGDDHEALETEDESYTSNPKSSGNFGGIWGPKIRVASGRFRLRPSIGSRVSSPGGDSMFMLPTDLNHSPPDETSVSGSPLANSVPKTAAITEIDTSPFTSPSSPKFGFPMLTSSATSHQRQPQSVSAPIEIVVTNSNNVDAEKPTAAAAGASSASNRKQRSFTYHSNHELAASMDKQTQKQSRNHQTSPPQALAAAPVANSASDQLTDFDKYHGRSNRMFDEMIALPPPADVVMGRRVDDSPSESNSEDSNQSYQPTSHRRAREAASTSHAAGDKDDGHYRTIVV